MAAKRRKTAASKTRSRSARGFEAGRDGRRLRAIPSSNIAINTQIRAYGRTALARSRHLCINNAYATAAKAAYVSALVGTGIVPSSLVEDEVLKAAITSTFNDWTDEADADGLTDFYGLQAIIAGEMFEAGECFVRMRPRKKEDGLIVPLQLQLLPSEMLPLDRNEALNDGARIECGIEFSPIGKRVAYHFWRRHPGELSVFNSINSLDTVRVPAEEVLHLYKPFRAGQVRGVPHTLAGITISAMMDLYDDAELERKRTAALFGGFVTRPKVDDQDHPLGKPDDDSGRSTANDQFGLEPGAMVDLEPGEDIKFSAPADVGNSYEAFQYRNLLRSAAGYGVTYSDMTGDLRQATYGSLRGGMIQFRRKIEMDQHGLMVYQFCRPITQRFLDLAVLGGILPLKVADYVAKRVEYSRTKYIPPRWEWIDPLKDRQAEKLAVDEGFKSVDDVIEAEGYDPLEVDKRIAAAQERRSRLGIVLAADKEAAAKAAADEVATEDAEAPTEPPAPPKKAKARARKRKGK